MVVSFLQDKNCRFEKFCKKNLRFTQNFSFWQGMKTFPAILNNILKRGSFNAAQLAAETGINEGNLSRIRSGQRSVTQENLTQLLTCSLLSRDDCRLLLLAYIRDAVPAGWENQISISLKDAKPQDSPLSPVEDALEFLRRKSQSNEAIQSVLLDLHRALAGSKA